MFDAFGRKTEPYMFFIFRVIFGLVFMLHGMQKLGWLGAAAKTGLFLFVGIGEFMVGLGIALGLFTRLASIGGVIIMLGANIMAHWPNGINPLSNGGEAAILNLAAFLILFSLGAGKWSLNHLFFKKEML